MGIQSGKQKKFGQAYLSERKSADMPCSQFRRPICPCTEIHHPHHSKSCICWSISSKVKCGELTGTTSVLLEAAVRWSHWVAAFKLGYFDFPRSCCSKCHESEANCGCGTFRRSDINIHVLSVILTTNDRGDLCSIGIRDDAKCVKASSSSVTDCSREKSNITSLSVEGKEVKSQTAHICLSFVDLIVTIWESSCCGSCESSGETVILNMSAIVINLSTTFTLSKQTTSTKSHCTTTRGSATLCRAFFSCKTLADSGAALCGD